MTPIAIDEDIPFFGIGTQQQYHTLSEQNPILFRLHTDLSPDFGLQGPIVAPAYAESHQGRASQIPVRSEREYSDGAKHILACKYMARSSADVLNSTPWLSTTFSFAFVLWEACRRVMYGVAKEQHLYIILIHGAHYDVQPRCQTGVHWLTTHGGQPGTQEWNLANASQEVLVHGYIPAESIIAIVPWKVLRNALPKEYRERDFMVLTDRRVTAFRDYAWTVAAALKNGHSQSSLIHGATGLAVSLLERKLAGAASDSGSMEDPAQTVRMACETVSAVGFWIARYRGPYTELYDASRAESEVLRQRVVRFMVRHPSFGRWSALVRAQLRMEEISTRYSAYKRALMDRAKEEGIRTARNKLTKALENTAMEVGR